MSDLDVWWWCSFNPVAETPNLRPVLELVALQEEGPKGLAVVTHLSKLLAASEVRIRLE